MQQRKALSLRSRPNGNRSRLTDSYRNGHQHRVRELLDFAGRERWNQRSPGSILVFMSDVTQILSQIDQGDPSAAEQLLPLVYDELRRLTVIIQESWFWAGS